jgi:phosphatidylinositol-3-phosphatase
MLVAFALAALMLPIGVTGRGVAPDAPSADPPPSVVPATLSHVSTGVVFPTPIRHVVTILLENENAGTVIQNGSYEKYLASKYATASSYYSVCHPSAPNYLALTSGNSWQCGSDNYSVYDSANIADLVQSAGLTWGGYMESMPLPCDLSNSALYAVRHNPFVYYQDIVDNASRCDSHVLNFTAWSDAVATNTVPNYAFITPNILDDGHNTNVSYADNWLRGWLTPLLNDSFAQSTVFFIVYDESANSNTGYDGLDGGQVYFAAVGPDVRSNFTFTANASQYNLLSTTEWLLGLGSTGHNDSGTAFPAMESLFQPNAPTEYSLAGEVRSAVTGRAIPGAEVTIAGGAASFCNSSGAYQFSLTNGSYGLTASADGYVPFTASATIDGGTVAQNFSLAEVPYPISGRVTNLSSGIPISGATLSVAGTVRATTNATGGYSFAVVAGSYAVTSAATGYRSVTSDVTVNGSGSTANFALGPLSVPVYALSGLVTYESNGSAVPNATVELSLSDALTTPANGSFQFEVPNGTYELIAELNGFRPASVRVTIAGAGRVQNFSLSRGDFYLLTGSVVATGTDLPVSGANVTLTAGDWQLTDSSGSYSFLVWNGTFDLVATAPGYEPVHENVTIDGSSLAQAVMLYLTLSAPLPASQPSPWGLYAAITAIAVGSVALAVVLLRRPPRRGGPPAVSSPTTGVQGENGAR